MKRQVKIIAESKGSSSNRLGSFGIPILFFKINTKRIINSMRI